MLISRASRSTIFSSKCSTELLAKGKQVGENSILKCPPHGGACPRGGGLSASQFKVHHASCSPHNLLRETRLAHRQWIFVVQPDRTTAKVMKLAADWTRYIKQLHTRFGICSPRGGSLCVSGGKPTRTTNSPRWLQMKLSQTPHCTKKWYQEPDISTG